MRKEDKINVNGIEVAVKELTVAEVRHWMMDMIESEKAVNNDNIVGNVLNQSLFEEIGLNDIIRMTDLNSCQIENFTPSELHIIIQKCKVLNPDFFGMRRRLLSSALSKV